MSGIRRASIAGATALVSALFISLALAASSSAVSVSTVASGLDNPRDLAFDSDGHLFVAEAGHGSEPVGKECGPPGPGGEPQCAGFTSGVSRIDNGVAHKVVSGLISIAGPNGSAALGLDGISILGDWRLFATEAESEFALPPSGFSKETAEKAKQQLGRLYEFTPGPHTRAVANVGAFDFKWSEEPKNKEKVPDQFPDANPHAVFAEGETQWVVDAASNTLDEVRENGSVRIVAFIPNPRVSDSVPTCIDRGPDGAFYIGQLTGGGNGPGAAAIWRVEPWNGDVSKWATGLTAITGCGFDSDGDFYAAEFSTLGFESFKAETGALVRVPPHSTSPVTVVPKLSFPGGFAAAGDSVYISNGIIFPAESHAGQVVRAVVEEGDQQGGGNNQQGGHEGNGQGGHGENGNSHGGHDESAHRAKSGHENSRRGRRD